MSKMDNLRAMREARYEERRRARRQPAPRRPTAATAPERSTPTPASHAARGVPDPPEARRRALCGHRAISGRTCTREAGHAAKSHRYS